MSTSRDDNSTDFTDVFHGIFEKNKSHVDITVIVFSQGFFKVFIKMFVRHLVIDSIPGDTVREITENKIISILWLEIFREIKFREILFD